jgi:hypothetical protein
MAQGDEDADITAEGNRSHPAIDVQHEFAVDGAGRATVEAPTDAPSSLTDYGAQVDPGDPESVTDRPTASEFGVDDRADTGAPDRQSADKQAPLFADVDEDQVTLTGDQAAGRFLFSDASDPAEDSAADDG